MASVQCTVESAVQFFFYQWYCGLRPALNLETQPNGDVSVLVKITCPADQHQSESNTNFKQCRSKRSSRGSRRRRQELRQLNKSSGSTQSLSPDPSQDSLQTKLMPSSSGNLSDIENCTTATSTVTSVVDPCHTSIVTSSNSCIPPVYDICSLPPFSTSSQIPSTATTSTLHTPSHLISQDEIRRIMAQISKNFGTALEIEVSKMLNDQGS